MSLYTLPVLCQNELPLVLINDRMILSTTWYHLFFSSSSHATKPLNSRQSFKNSEVFSSSCVNQDVSTPSRWFSCSEILRWVHPARGLSLLQTMHALLAISHPDLLGSINSLIFITDDNRSRCHIWCGRESGNTVLLNSIPSANSIHKSFSSYRSTPPLFNPDLFLVSWTLLALPS